jgi:hypothetical protein
MVLFLKKKNKKALLVNLKFVCKNKTEHPGSFTLADISEPV